MAVETAIVIANNSLVSTSQHPSVSTERSSGPRGAYPGSNTATIACFCSMLHRRYRSGPANDAAAACHRFCPSHPFRPRPWTGSSKSGSPRPRKPRPAPPKPLGLPTWTPRPGGRCGAGGSAYDRGRGPRRAGRLRWPGRAGTLDRGAAALGSGAGRLGGAGPAGVAMKPAPLWLPAESMACAWGGTRLE